MMRLLFMVLILALGGCQREATPPQAKARTDVVAKASKTKAPRLTADYCATEEALKTHDNTKSCVIEGCEQGEKSACDVARIFATAQAPQPKKLEGMVYVDAREVVLGMGWTPLDGPCEGIMSETTCAQFPEIGNCSGTGMGFCDMHFARRNRCLTVITVGGPPDREFDGEPAVRDVSFSKAPCAKDPNAGRS